MSREREHDASRLLDVIFLHCDVIRRVKTLSLAARPNRPNIISPIFTDTVRRSTLIWLASIVACRHESDSRYTAPSTLSAKETVLTWVYCTCQQSATREIHDRDQQNAFSFTNSAKMLRVLQAELELHKDV